MRNQEISAQAKTPIPRKFLDAKTGAVNLDGLVQSYRSLEKRLSQQDPSPSAVAAPAMSREEALRVLGVPETPEQYRVEILEDFLDRDPEMEALLHQAGFTEEQVQLVYDLAAERLAPLMAEVVQAARGAGDSARLEAHFGGPQRWKETQRQLKKWGEKKLPPDAFNALCCSYDGVLALHRMMGAGDEPGLTHGGDSGDALNEAQLKRLMNDPRYWRDHDTTLTRKVEQGFKRLYPGGA